MVEWTGEKAERVTKCREAIAQTMQKYDCQMKPAFRVDSLMFGQSVCVALVVEPVSVMLAGRIEKQHTRFPVPLRVLGVGG